MDPVAWPRGWRQWGFRFRVREGCWGVQGVGPGRQEGHSPIELLSLGIGTQKVLC